MNKSNQDYQNRIEGMVKAIVPSVIQSVDWENIELTERFSIDCVDQAKSLIEEIDQLILEREEEDPDQVKINYPGKPIIEDLKKSGEEMIDALKKMDRQKMTFVPGPEQIEGTVSFNEKTQRFEHRDDDGDLIELNDQGIFQKVKIVHLKSDQLEGEEKQHSINRGKSVYNELNDKIRSAQKHDRPVHLITIHPKSFNDFERYTQANQMAGVEHLEVNGSIRYQGTRLIRTVDVALGIVKIF